MGFSQSLMRVPTGFDSYNIRTSAKYVICSEIKPGFDGGPIADFLPIAQLYQNYRYVDELNRFAEFKIVT